jgi:TonB-linked SusC/RagA family outer membrane protein
LVASNDPLIILDGMQYDGVLGDLNPYDIASVDVLKDASSTAIYGSRGANGVIIITSKRGITSKPKITLESTGGIQSTYGRLPYANGVQYAEYAREAYRTQGGYPFSTTNAAQDAIIFDAIELPTVLAGGNGLDYQDMIIQNGNQQKHQLTVSGGSETSKYNVTGNFFKQEGIMKGDEFNRISLSPKLDFTISPTFSAGTSIQLNYTNNSELSNPIALTQYAFNGNPLGQVYEKDGITPRFALTTDGFEINPMVDYWYDSHRADNKGWGGSLNAFMNAKIIPGLSYRLQLGTNFRLGTNKASDGYYSIARNLGLPVASVANSVNNFKSYQSILTYDKRIKDHHFTLTAINEFQSSRQETSGAGVSDLPYEAARYNNLGSANTVSSVSSGLRETSLLSYAGRVFYGYKSKYVFQATMRADAASQLAPGHKWGYFPSASVAWTVTQENFMKSTKNWLTDLKFRVGYGVSGNQAIAPYQTQGSLLRTTYSFNEVAGFGYRQQSQSNKDLKWESSKAYNVGVDYSLFNGKLNGNVEVYNTDTYDLLMFRKLPITSGYDQVLQNVGSTLNKGVEVGIRSTNIQKPNFRWSTGLIVSRNRTEITSLYNGTSDDIGNGWFIGHDINVYYDYNKVGIWQTSEAAQALSYGRTVGQIKDQDVNSDGKINAQDLVILGDHQPDFIGNLSNNFTYKNWDLAVAFNIRWGGMTSVGAFAPYAKKRYNKFIFDYWTPNNPTNAYPRPNQLYEDSGLDGSTLTYRDQSQINMQIFALGYTIPKAWLAKIHFNNARIYFSGENLWYWTKSELRDFNMKPDFAGNTTLTYPSTRTVIMGVNIGF